METLRPFLHDFQSLVGVKARNPPPFVHLRFSVLDGLRCRIQMWAALSPDIGLR